MSMKKPQFTIEPLERKDYQEVFSTMPFTTPGVNLVEIQKNAVFQPKGLIARDFKGNFIGAIIIHDYVIRPEMMELDAIRAAYPNGPVGPFQVSFWTTSVGNSMFMGIKLIKRIHTIIRDGDTSLFDLTPSGQSERRTKILVDLYNRSNLRDTFIKNGRIYLQNKEGNINDGKERN